MPALQTRGDYLNNVPRWDKRFTEENLLYLPYGQIEKDPQVMLRKIENHCDLPSAKYPRAKEKVHRTDPLQLPDYVIERLEELAAPQIQFIREYFGEDFYNDS